MNICTEKECYQLLKEYGTPSHVIDHCKAVAKVGVCVGCALNQKGYALDLDLIQAAGLLHDIARVHPHHDRVGAEHLREQGHPREAEIVAVHMYYDKFNDVKNINEADIVCLADRVCKENKYVGFEERMNYILKKAEGNPKALKIIKKRKEELAEFIHQLEILLECTLDQLVKDHS